MLAVMLTADFNAATHCSARNRVRLAEKMDGGKLLVSTGSRIKVVGALSRKVTKEENEPSFRT